MAASGSSSSSFTSSSLGRPRGYAQTYTSPVDSTWTAQTPGSSAISALTSELSAPPTPLRPLDLGPPGYQATINLFQGLSNETTVYLGPWDIRGTNERRVVWQCSYQGDTLEHFLPYENPADLHPYTLHAHHRPYGDPADMELYLTFQEPHRIRYTTGDGVLHDDHIEVKYEFTTMEGSLRFQGDLRARDLIDYFDVDVVWTDAQGRQDSYGNVRGLGTIQRLKMWRDRYSSFHFIDFLANRSSRHRFREYQVNAFQPEPRNRDDRHRRLRLYARERRGSDTHDRERRPSASFLGFRPRQASAGHSSSHHSSRSSSSRSTSHQLDIRYLGIQFSRNDDYVRFFEQWTVAQNEDNEFQGVPFRPNTFELPSPELVGNSLSELPTVPEPAESIGSDATP